MKQTVAILIISSLLIFLFGYTAISKLVNADGFMATLRRIPILSSGAAVLAYAVPSAELVTVLLLLFSATRLKGLYASAGLLTLFTTYLLLMLLFAPERPCSCGGVISGMGWWEHVGMNGLLMGASVMGIRKLERERGGEAQRQRGTEAQRQQGIKAQRREATRQGGNG